MQTDSVFCVETLDLKVALLPCHLDNPLSAAKAQINSLLFNYNDDLQGIPLTYEDITLPNEHCKIIGEHPWLHLDIVTKMLVFVPKVGVRVEGQITMVSDSHISLLLYGLINASISKDNLAKNFAFNADLQCWEGINSALSEGESMTVTIASFQHSNGLLNIDAVPVI